MGGVDRSGVRQSRRDTEDRDYTEAAIGSYMNRENVKEIPGESLSNSLPEDCGGKERWRDV